MRCMCGSWLPVFSLEWLDLAPPELVLAWIFPCDHLLLQQNPLPCLLWSQIQLQVVSLLLLKHLSSFPCASAKNGCFNTQYTMHWLFLTFDPLHGNETCSYEMQGLTVQQSSKTNSAMFNFKLLLSNLMGQYCTTCFLEFDGDMMHSRPCHKLSHCQLWSWNLCDNTSEGHSSKVNLHCT